MDAVSFIYGEPDGLFAEAGVSDDNMGNNLSPPAFHSTRWLVWCMIALAKANTDAWGCTVGSIRCASELDVSP